MPVVFALRALTFSFLENVSYHLRKKTDLKEAPPPPPFSAYLPSGTALTVLILPSALNESQIYMPG